MDLPILLDWPITTAKLLKPTNLSLEISSGLFTLVFLVGGVVILIRGTRGLLTRARVDAPEATLSKNNPLVGEVVRFSYRQTFRIATDVPGIKFQLIKREAATYRSGTDVATDTHDDIVQEYQMPGRHFEPGQTLEAEYDFQPQGMHSYDGPSNEIDWLIHAQVEMAGLPAFTAEYPLEVQPELAR